MTQKDLAQRTGLAKSTISLLERGEQFARISTVRRLAGALDVSPAELLADTTLGKSKTFPVPTVKDSQSNR
jgi:transcriptional regulator with XRE-family HTH domain